MLATETHLACTIHEDGMFGLKTVTYAKTSPKMVNPRGIAGNAEEEVMNPFAFAPVTSTLPSLTFCLCVCAFMCACVSVCLSACQTVCLSVPLLSVEIKCKRVKPISAEHVHKGMKATRLRNQAETSLVACQCFPFRVSPVFRQMPE